VFSSVLIANRGEIACRIAATCSRLGLRSVAVYSEADVGARHVKLADEAHCVGRSPALESYLNVPSLLRVVRASGSEAVHPGYGFLSENASFATALELAGIAFIGPRPTPLRLLADKLEARRMASAVGFEPVPGSPGAVSASQHDLLIAVAKKIGFPVLIKAAGGGGGIGTQIANDASELVSAAHRAESISQRSFADGRVYVEKYIEHPRHVEIQVLRAHNGSVFVLGNRECSVQRRYQKLIEECPSPSLSALCPDQLRDLEISACRLLEFVDYVGVATVELLLGDEVGPYFLEVNARLQVEHTVTEMVFGLDLVELQLKLAAGEDVRSILSQACPNGHAIEARICSEDPCRSFLPQSGIVESLVFPSGAGIRVDSGIEAGCTISPYYDPLLAKVIGWGASREQATSCLAKALAATQISVVSKHGPRTNNLALLRQVLSTSEWAAGAYDTKLIERLVPQWRPVTAVRTP
jgi:acetyl/propionyl-CoA carboxylase alpha subunit